jgi:hypothetical protein
MESQEPTVVVVPAESEIVQIEHQLEQELVEIEGRIARSGTAWLRDVSSFATALIVSTAGVAFAGVIALLFCLAFFVAAPLLLLVLAVVMARGMRRPAVSS